MHQAVQQEQIELMEFGLKRT